MNRKSARKTEDTFIGSRRYLHRPTKVSSSAHEGIFMKMGGQAGSEGTDTLIHCKYSVNGDTGVLEFLNGVVDDGTDKQAGF